jgi:hypothetical protein
MRSLYQRLRNTTFAHGAGTPPVLTGCSFGAIAEAPLAGVGGADRGVRAWAQVGIGWSRGASRVRFRDSLVSA